MPQNFIFAKDVQAVLKDGAKEIRIPEGSRISSAALDLIKENRIEVIYVGESSGKQEEVASSEEAFAGDTPASAKDEGDVGAVTEEEVEQIARRVIERLREVRGESSPGASGDERGRDSEDEDDDMVICRCEEITKGEIKDAIRNGMRTLNGVKRVTRAGMGLCQGQTCQRLVTQILAGEIKMPPAEINPTTPRAPVRPVRISVLATG
jgi:bacterioferritin-associated ferredoxin